MFWVPCLLASDPTEQYVVPFLCNLSGSILFFMTLNDAELSIAVPVANATTFASTALLSGLLGEKLHWPQTCAGICLLVIGLYLCQL